MPATPNTTTPPERHRGFNPQDLLSAAAFPHTVGELSVRETHISWVILTGQFAYKIKKPARLDFLDCSTLEQRQHFCNEELRLNRRLVPELYLDVVPITCCNGSLHIGGDGVTVEYAVRMKQFDAAAELPQLLRMQRVERKELLELAELLARFHLHTPVARPGTELVRTQQTLDAVLGNLSQLLAQSESLQAAPSLRTLSGWCHEQAVALESVLAAREKDGFVRECHGDLHAANIVRYGLRLVPFDGIEFDPSLRWIDVMNDLAFLLMDLVSSGRHDLALTVLSRYLEVTGDYAGVSLIPFYCVYRALVRAKIDGLLLHQRRSVPPSSCSG
jgi:aminoglycoside phosphotransferase family enzyme